MLHKPRTGLAVAMLGLALGAFGSLTVLAQDQRPEDQAPHDQARRDDQLHHDEQATGDVERYRKAHPHAAARCHDGFFTNTTDRKYACSKHGGIDVWLHE